MKTPDRHGGGAARCDSSNALLGEELLGLAAVAKLFPAARGTRATVNPSTVNRWIFKGTKARNGEVIKLEHARAGSRVLTSRQAVARFVAALTAADGADTNQQQPVRSSAEARERSEAAVRALAELGA